MIIVSDTSPLHYLVLLGEVELLPRLYGTVLCPREVIRECRDLRAPASLRLWAADPPGWLVIEDVAAVSIELLSTLNPGEAAAIVLCLQARAGLLLIDERKGRRIAQELGLSVAGTLNILAEAAARGWLDFDAVVHRLRTDTNFRVADSVVAAVRQQTRRH